MTPKAKAAIADLLEPGESLADASTWADENRGGCQRPPPGTTSTFRWTNPIRREVLRRRPTKGCVVDKINEFRLVMKDQVKSVEDRRFALRFLIHCLEDMHHAVHVGDNNDKGGNRTQVRFFDRGTNMHALWDTGMIKRVSTSEDFWLADLANWTRQRIVRRR